MNENTDQFEVDPNELIGQLRADLGNMASEASTLRAVMKTERRRRLDVETKLAHILGQLPELCEAAGVDPEETIAKLTDGAEFSAIAKQLDETPADTDAE